MITLYVVMITKKLNLYDAARVLVFLGWKFGFLSWTVASSHPRKVVIFGENDWCNSGALLLLHRVPPPSCPFDDGARTDGSAACRPSPTTTDRSRPHLVPALRPGDGVRPSTIRRPVALSAPCFASYLSSRASLREFFATFSYAPRVCSCSVYFFFIVIVSCVWVNSAISVEKPPTITAIFRCRYFAEPFSDFFFFFHYSRIARVEVGVFPLSRTVIGGLRNYCWRRRALDTRENA